MGSQDLLRWCAGIKCPATLEQGCSRYITANQLNQTAQSFVACCEIQCGQSANSGFLGLKCGGATTATAVSTCIYLVLLLLVGVYMVALGPFRRMKTITKWIILIGSVIFSTGTGVFVTNVSSPFMVLQTAPALGAMNVAIFSYFCSGFHYGVGLGYESGPLFAFLGTAWTIGKELNDSTPKDGFIRTGRYLAVAMLASSFTWIVHSISYRLFGYRVDWKICFPFPNSGQQDSGSDLGVAQADPTRRRDRSPKRQQDPRFHLGAAQGHPTWRTPMGQSTSVIMTALSWSLVRVVKKDLEEVQKCRPDWVFQTMLYGAPILISFTIVWNIISGMRCRTVSGQISRDTRDTLPVPSMTRRRSIVEQIIGSQDVAGSWSRLDAGSSGAQPRDSITTRSDYPGLQSYMDFIDSIQSLETTNNHIKEYTNAVALQRMQRNTMFAEQVPDKRLRSSDKVVGCIVWFLAQGGLVISFPGFCSVWLVTELLGMAVEFLVQRFNWCHRWLSPLVTTEVTDEDHMSAAKVVEECNVGVDLSDEELTKWEPTFELLNHNENHRCINLNTLLEGTGPSELYNLLSQAGMSHSGKIPEEFKKAP